VEDIKYSQYNGIIISPRPDDKYKILKDFTYKDITVPAGFHTNGANIPRFLWSFYPPNRSTYLPAVIVHDYLCNQEEYKKADEIFKEMLTILLGQKRFTINFFYHSVRLYHRFKYKIK